MKEVDMIKVSVKIDDEERVYEFKSTWQVEWFVRILNFIARFFY